MCWTGRRADDAPTAEETTAVPHGTALIATICVSLAFAFLGGFLAVRLRLPPLIGYLLAGVAVGPFTPGFVADVHLAAELAEIGVMLALQAQSGENLR
jgi:K+:H+ antiporter